MCLTQKREIKVIQNTKFLQNREIKVSQNMRTSKSRNRPVVKISCNKVIHDAIGCEDSKQYLASGQDGSDRVSLGS